MFTEPSFNNAKFHRTLLVDPVGLCYVITPVSRPINSDLNNALWQYQNKYWADHLLRTHCNSWGYRFDLPTLYRQLCPTPLQRHKSYNDMIDELSDRMANGELLVYCVHNFISPPSGINQLS